MVRSWLALVSAAAALLMFSAHVHAEELPVPGLRYASPYDLFDDVDKRENFQNETNAELELFHRSMSRKIIEFMTPYCNFNDWTKPYCCGAVILFNTEYLVCAKAVLTLKNLTLYAALTVNENVLVDITIHFGKFCVRFPPFPKLSICIHIYYIDLQLANSPTFFKTCLTSTVADLLEVRFYCLQLNKGQLTREDDQDPDYDHIPFAVMFKKDKVLFKFRGTIPELLLKILGNVVSIIGDAVMMVVNTVKTVVTKVINTIGNFFKKLFG